MVFLVRVIAGVAIAVSVRYRLQEVPRRRASVLIRGDVVGAAGLQQAHTRGPVLPAGVR